MRSVQDSAELQRILRIPRRVWSADDSAAWAARWTDALGRAPRDDCPTSCVCGGAGQMSLRPIQGIALSEIAQYGGGLFPIRVGGGKTLISFLAPRVLPQVRAPLLLLPAHLVKKTQREMALYRKHWNLPPFIRVESYQLLSRVGGATLLRDYQPDLIICDEAHALKDPSGTRAKRINRYLRERGGVPLVIMSGTLTKRSIGDFAHLSSWSLRERSPVPLPQFFHVLEEWKRAIDVNVAEHRRLDPGALTALGAGPVRPAFQRRLVETPGVVATQEGPLPIELRIRSHAVEIDAETFDAYRTLRLDWRTPDEWDLEDGVAVWRHARELSSGFYSRWDPRPPERWREARRDWAKACRDIIAHNRRELDTELQVRRAVLDGYRPEAEGILRRWLEIAPTFEPNPEAVWFSDRLVGWCAAWAKERPGLVWVERPAFGDRLARMTGMPYYANLGLDDQGRFVGDHPPTSSAIVSIEANSVGRNLQAFNRNLIVDVQPNGARWEQMLGRTHRDGQRAKVVEVDVLFGCIEDVEGFWRAVRDSQYAEDMTGQAQKLVHADLEQVEEVEAARLRAGPQWNKKG